MSEILALRIPAIGNKKTVISAIALIIVLAFPMFAASSVVNGQTQSTSQCATYAFINVGPNPVGVGQEVNVNSWLSLVIPNAAGPSGDRFTGFTVTILLPDGTTQTQKTSTTNDLSSAYFSYTPTEVGKYTFTTNWPGEYFTDLDINYLPSNASYVLTVQQQPVAEVPTISSALPTSFWTRPVNAQNEAWSSIQGNWLMQGWDVNSRTFDNGVAYDPFTSAPTSAHVLWTSPLTFGGQTGAQFGTTSYYNGMSYEQFFKPPVIIDGRLYYNTIQAEEPTAPGLFGGGDENLSTITCMDMSTGQTLFTIPSATLAFGQIYNFISPNQGGTFAYLWDTSAGSTWKMYDAWTGNYMLSFANVPSGTVKFGTDGSILVYNLAQDPTTHQYQLTLWNSTNVILNPDYPFKNPLDNIWTWRPYDDSGMTLNAVGNTTMGGVSYNTNGVEWVKTLADVPAGSAILQVGEPWDQGYQDNEIILDSGTTTLLQIQANIFVPGTYNYFPNSAISHWMGFDLSGNKLWGPTTIDLTGLVPANSSLYASSNIGPGNVLTLFDKETMQWYGFNITSGQKMWGPTPAYTNPLGMYDFQGGGKFVVNGILYNAGYDGMIHAFNATTGTPLWTFYDGDSGVLTPYGTWPFYNGLTIAGGELFATTGEHGNGVQPLYEGEGLYVLDAATGTQLWNITGWFCQPAIADGMAVSQNLYDNQIYCFGKGPSATTVTATAGVGNAVTIQGFVTDQSAGAKQLVQSGKFNIVPAVADDWQGAWMNYLYEQQPMPTNAKGVPVLLTITDSGGNVVSTMNAQTDINGHYMVSWTPTATGAYKVTVSFGGSNSYYASKGVTGIAVGTGSSSSPSVSSTSSPSPATAPTQGQSSETYIVVVAAIVIIVVAAAAIILRRRTK